MKGCSKCDNQNPHTLAIITHTHFIQGDSKHLCFVRCQVCQNASQLVSGIGLFSDKTLIKAIDNWDKENPLGKIVYE